MFLDIILMFLDIILSTLMYLLSGILFVIKMSLLCICFILDKLISIIVSIVFWYYEIEPKDLSERFCDRDFNKRFCDKTDKIRI